MLLVLDVPTMLLMTAAASLAMAVSLAAARPQRSKGTGLWALGLVLHAATYVLYTLRGMVPDWASIVVSNMLLAGTFAMALGPYLSSGAGPALGPHAGAGGGDDPAVRALH